ncbi:MAG: cysteine desulfurase family protein [Bacillota bacterium]
MGEVYLDHSATSPLRPEAFEAVRKALLEEWGNPSSVHRKGVGAERLMEGSRQVLADALRVSPEEVIFTSGATEANNLAVKGVARALGRYGNHLITTRVEHPSVYEAFKDLEDEGFQVTYLHVDREGIVDPEELRKAITPRTILVSVMHVNNETGAVQPIQEIGSVLKGIREKIVFHVDAVQSFCKMPVLPYEWGIDLVSLSSHKIGGPKGVGALFMRKGVKVAPVLSGGGQEKGLRSGTENVPGIAGFAAAVAACNWKEESARLWHLRRRLLERALKIDGAVLVGPTSEERCAPHIVNLSFPGLRGELLLHHLEEQGVYVSTGSACSSRKRAPSRVLVSMGLPQRDVEGSIRISMGWNTTEGEVEYACQVVASCVEKLRALVR